MRKYIGKCTVKMLMAVMVFAFTLTMLFSGVTTTHAQEGCDVDIGSCMQCCADEFQGFLDSCLELPPDEKHECINGTHGANDRFDGCRSSCIAFFAGGL